MPNLDNVVAIIYNDLGKEYDRAYTWQTGECFAMEGYTVKAIANDGYMSIARAQEIYDGCLDAYRDCFQNVS